MATRWARQHAEATSVCATVEDKAVRTAAAAEDAADRLWEVQRHLQEYNVPRYDVPGAVRAVHSESDRQGKCDSAADQGTVKSTTLGLGSSPSVGSTTDPGSANAVERKDGTHGHGGRLAKRCAVQGHTTEHDERRATQSLAIATRVAVQAALAHVQGLTVLAWPKEEYTDVNAAQETMPSKDRSSMSDTDGVMPTCDRGTRPSDYNERVDFDASAITVQVANPGSWTARISLDSLHLPSALFRVHAIAIHIAEDPNAPRSVPMDSPGNTSVAQDEVGSGSDASVTANRTSTAMSPEQHALLRRMVDDRIESAAAALPQGISVMLRYAVMMSALRDVLNFEVCAPLVMDLLSDQARALATGPWGSTISIETPALQRARTENAQRAKLPHPDPQQRSAPAAQAQAQTPGRQSTGAHLRTARHGSQAPAVEGASSGGASVQAARRTTPVRGGIVIRYWSQSRDAATMSIIPAHRVRVQSSAAAHGSPSGKPGKGHGHNAASKSTIKQTAPVRDPGKLTSGVQGSDTAMSGPSLDSTLNAASRRLDANVSFLNTGHISPAVALAQRGPTTVLPGGQVGASSQGSRGEGGSSANTENAVRKVDYEGLDANMLVYVTHDPPLPGIDTDQGFDARYALTLDFGLLNLERLLIGATRARSCARLLSVADALSKKPFPRRVPRQAMRLLQTAELKCAFPRCGQADTDSEATRRSRTILPNTLCISVGGPRDDAGIRVSIFALTGGLRVQPIGSAALAALPHRYQELGLWTGDRHMQTAAEEESAVATAVLATRNRLRLEAAARSVCAIDVGVSDTLPPGTASVAVSGSGDRAASQLVPPFAPLERRAPKRFLTLSPPPPPKGVSVEEPCSRTDEFSDFIHGRLASSTSCGASFRATGKRPAPSMPRSSRSSGKRTRLTYATTIDALVFIQESSVSGGHQAWGSLRTVEDAGPRGRKRPNPDGRLDDVDGVDRYSGSAAAAAAWTVTRDVVERRFRRDLLLRAFVAANVASAAQTSRSRPTDDGAAMHIETASRTLLKVKCEPLPVRSAELLLRGHDAWQVRLSLLPPIFDSTDDTSRLGALSAAETEDHAQAPDKGGGAATAGRSQDGPEGQDVAPAGTAQTSTANAESQSFDMLLKSLGCADAEPAKTPSASAPQAQLSSARKRRRVDQAAHPQDEACGTLWSIGVACTGPTLTFTYPSASAASVRSFFRDLTRARTAAALARGVPESHFYRVLRRSPVRIVVGIGPFSKPTARTNADPAAHSEDNEAAIQPGARPVSDKPLYTATVEYVYWKGNSGGFSLHFSPPKRTMRDLAPLIEEALDASGGQVGGILAGLLERACPVAAAAQRAVCEQGNGTVRFLTALRVRAVFTSHGAIAQGKGANANAAADSNGPKAGADRSHAGTGAGGSAGSQRPTVSYCVDMDARGGGGLVKVIDVGRATAVMIQQGLVQRPSDNVPLPHWERIVEDLSKTGAAQMQRAGAMVVLKMEVLEPFLSDLVTSSIVKEPARPPAAAVPAPASGPGDAARSSAGV